MARYLITSALPYVNGVKHLGNLVGSILPADVYARHLRQQGEEVLYICGTDEHGTPAELAAKKAGQPVEVFCKDMHMLQKHIYECFLITFDYFGRSSSLSNHEMTQYIFGALDKNGFIVEHEIKQVYSIDDKRFLPDRYVSGTCPHCGYQAARGDQCENCDRLLDPTELINPHSTISGSKNLEVRKEKHLFLRLSALEKDVSEWAKKQKDWPVVTKGIVKKWLDEGLKERCISRDLKWGVKIPKPGYENKVFYVWFDAPIAYMSITKDWAKQEGDEKIWESWWKKPHEVTYVQFMAKDNVPFHAVFWPAILMGTKENWKLPDNIKGFSWLTYEGGKFSTSHHRGIFTDVALNLFPADYWRYYLLSIAPESSDSDFSFAGFAIGINKDLADVLGNFVSRVTALVDRYFGNKIPEVSDGKDQNFSKIVSESIQLLNEIDQSIRALKFRQATQQLRALWSLGNEYIAKEKPWMIIKEDEQKAGRVLKNCLHLIRLYAIASASIIPNTAEILFQILNEAEEPHKVPFRNAANFSCLSAGKTLNKHGNLFVKITKEQTDELHKRFSGEKLG